MNLRQLYYFKAIAELEHYTRAAAGGRAERGVLRQAGPQRRADQVWTAVPALRPEDPGDPGDGDHHPGRLHQPQHGNGGHGRLPLPGTVRAGHHCALRVRDQPGGRAPAVQPGGHLHPAEGAAAGRGGGPDLRHPGGRPPGGRLLHRRAPDRPAGPPEPPAGPV